MGLPAMHRISSRKLVSFALMAAALYFVLLLTVPAGLLTEVFNGVFLGIVGTVTVVFFPLFVRSIRKREFDRVSQMTIGIMLTWVSLILSRSISTAVNAAGPELRTQAAPLIALAAYVAIIGGILHVTAPGMVENEWRYNKRLLATGVIVGLIVAAVTIAVQRQGLPT